ncbi:MAG: S8 family serine peptidase [Armatimonadetes bacterium]|nr:S8 family serine peptidase [Armatimonadota bacterium]
MSRLCRRYVPRCCALLVITVLVALAVPGWSASEKALQDLAGPLRALALAATQGGIAGQAFPLLKGPEQNVQVVILFQSPYAAASTSLGPYGGVVQFRRDVRVQAIVPVTSLTEIADLPQVRQIRAPLRPVPLQGFGTYSSEGVQLVGAVPYHVSGLMGQGVDVAIIDMGFNDYQNAEIPIDPNDPARTISFAAGGGMTGSYHGTAVAEVVADMAPGARFTLINVDTNMAWETAIEYARNQGFDVCMASLGAFGGPYDGTHPLDQQVDMARAAGVFYVNAAGNHAENHYQGTWTDHNGNGFHEFSGGDETIDLYLTAGQFMAYLSWWQTTPGGLTNHDYDLVLVDAADHEIARSGFTQNGDDQPLDVLLAYINTDGNYGLKIEYYGGPTPHQDMFQLFSPDVPLEGVHQVAESSLLIPAAAQGAYSVGATRGAVITGSPFGDLAVDDLETFSSQGPVVGHPERIKPDLVAPDGVETSLAAEGLSPFYGTSAAAPHVAGAACLILSEDQLRTADEVQSILQRQALPLGTGTPNNLFGYGRLRMRVGADSRAPRITIAYPQNGDTITTRTPTVTAYITDDGSGVDPTTIVVKLNGTVVLDGSDPGTDISNFYNSANGKLQWPVGSALARTNHVVSIQCSDLSGNESDEAITNFRVAAPTIPGGVRIVSFPYWDLQQTDPSIILGTPLSEMALVRWMPTDAGYDKYHFYPDAAATLTPSDCQQADINERTVPYPPAGLGYFLSIPQTAVLDIQGRSVQEFPSVHVRLFTGQHAPRGWNLIGNPYEEPTSWGAVQFVTNGVAQDLREAIDAGVTEGVLFDYVSPQGGQPGYYDFASDPTTAVMQPQKGYWIHVNQDTRVIFYSTAIAGAQAQPVAATSEAGKDGWVLRLCARAGAYQDPSNYIGVASTASAGYDPASDVPEPPALTRGLQLAMNHPGWGDNAGRYAKDIRGDNDPGRWDVEVSCALPNTRVTLTWPELNSQVPDDVRLVLEDLDSGRKIYMRTASRYEFDSGPDGSVRHLRIRTDSGSSHALAFSGMTTQSVAGGGAAIVYTLSASAEVSAEIRNIAGRLVRTLGSRTVEGGSQQTLMWNGRSNYGGPVPAGRYLVRLTARAEDGQTVQAIRPLNVVR